jgi:hypothetical protein
MLSSWTQEGTWQQAPHPAPKAHWACVTCPVVSKQSLISHNPKGSDAFKGTKRQGHCAVITSIKSIYRRGTRPQAIHHGVHTNTLCADQHGVRTDTVCVPLTCTAEPGGYKRWQCTSGVVHLPLHQPLSENTCLPTAKPPKML